MTNHVEQTAVPGWIVKVVITAVLGALITGASAWGVHLSTKSNDHEKRIAVTETKVDDVKDDIGEIKVSQKEMNNKLDLLLQQRR
jgi:hypothetical protein